MGADSFVRGLLDCPHYTRPAVFRGFEVPEVLMSGHHGEIRRWRKHAAVRRTLERRPDLLPNAVLDDEEREQLHRYTTTYFHETLNPDDRLGENFAISDMPSGTYAVSVGNGLSTVKKTVLIEADKLSWIEFTDVIPPATWTPTPTTTP